MNFRILATILLMLVGPNMAIAQNEPAKVSGRFVAGEIELFASLFGENPQQVRSKKLLERDSGKIGHAAFLDWDEKNRRETAWRVLGAACGRFGFNTVLYPMTDNEIQYGVIGEYKGLSYLR